MAQTLSIILAQYYPDKMQLRHTLDSLLIQDTYDFELIIADDGSPEDYWDDTHAYLAAHDFTNVKLSKNKVNQGTVTNMLHAVELASGQWIAGISPGDYVYDASTIRWVLEKALGREGIHHASFSSASDALAELERTPQPPAVLLSDIRMPGESGLDLLQKVKASHPQLPVIIMTAYSDLDSAVSAFQGGAFEYLPKPFDVDQAVALVRRALEQTAHQNGASEEATLAPEILGQAPAMQEVFRAIGRLAHSHATVLINGESGSGKELVARALHRHSPRRDAPFIAINTAAIPRDLLESELFGHERGAFTGAAT